MADKESRESMNKAKFTFTFACAAHLEEPLRVIDLFIVLAAISVTSPALTAYFVMSLIWNPKDSLTLVLGFSARLLI